MLTYTRPTLSEEQVRRQLLGGLIARYAGTHSPERVAEAVAEAYGRFVDVRVRTFVPILVERIVRQALDPARGRAGSARAGP